MTPPQESKPGGPAKVVEHKSYFCVELPGGYRIGPSNEGLCEIRCDEINKVYAPLLQETARLKEENEALKIALKEIANDICECREACDCAAGLNYTAREALDQLQQKGTKE